MKLNLKRVDFVVSSIAVLVLASADSVQAAGSSDAEYKLGLRDYTARKYKSAATHFYKSITAGNASPQAWLYLGHSYSASGKKSEAIKTYRKVAIKFKGSPAAKLANNAVRQLDSSSQRKEKKSSKSKVSSKSSYSTSSLPDRARVFYRSDDDDIMFKVRINGRPLEMEMDTGDPGTTLDKGHLRQLGIRPPKGKPAGYTGGASNSVKMPYWNMKVSVQVGPIRKDNMVIDVFEKMHTHPLLGQEFFKDFDYTVDHNAKCVEFRRKGATRAVGGSGYSLPFKFRKSGKRIVVMVEVNGRKGEAMLDTGNAANGISFDSKKQMAKFGVRVPANSKIGTSIGVSGKGSSYRFKLRRVRLGPIDKSNVSASCSISKNPADDELPLVGQEVLKGWQYSIDMKKKVIHFLRR